MSKREKIIVSIMAATLLLGGYLHFFPGTTGHRQGIENKPVLSNLDFTREIIQKLTEDTSLAKELFTIRSAERKWARDPFLKSDILLSDTVHQKSTDREPAGTGTRLDLVYTGFLEAGPRRLAIINGMEYEPGEAIDDQGHYVRRIQPRTVEIGKRNAPDVIIVKMTEYDPITGK